ncbi:MAG: apolipoprotein N-acyltransferase [Phycisphaerae bacterium]|nr:apolipoprotein N-acyltransferase [Phycisphaerae bacterium]
MERRQLFTADSMKVIALLTAGTVGLKSLIFPPVSWGIVAFFCLVPWLVVVSTSTNPRRVYISSFLAGFAFFLINMFWIWHVTGAGYVVWSACLAAYFPLVACPLRHWVRRRRLPAAVGLPIIWVGIEYVRAWMLTGFPWFFLGHSQYRFLSIIQISDLFGAYAVTFVVAAVNGAILDLLLPRLAGEGGPTAVPQPRWRWVGPGFAGVLLVGSLVYGQIQLHRGTTSPGPRVAVIQGDYPLFVEQVANPKRPEEKTDRYFELMGEAADHQPDLFLLPETPWPMYLNKELRELPPDRNVAVRWSRVCYDLFRDWARHTQSTVVTGAFSLELTPLSLRAKELNYNSAFVFLPDGSPAGRYDKNHRVVFGEFIPFRHGKLRSLYFWLHRFVPLAWIKEGIYEYSLTPGTEFKVFSMKAPSQGGCEYHFGVPICYEDVMPYVSRRFVTGPDGVKQVDFLLNISNDGWFLHSNELPQHLAIGAFRAVENRVGIARAVNTGISGFIDPNGAIRDLVTRDGRCHGPGIDGFSVARVMTDSRHTVYSRIGDVFARACMALWLLAYVDYFVVRALTRRREGQSREEAA